MVFVEPLEFVSETGAIYMIPAGATTDGASTPNALWPVLPPFGDYWRPAALHDAAYRGSLMRQMQNGGWAPALLTKDQADTLLLEAMMSVDVPIHIRDQIYEGVHHLGWRAFRTDNEAVLTAPIVLMKDPSV